MLGTRRDMKRSSRMNRTVRAAIASAAIAATLLVPTAQTLAGHRSWHGGHHVHKYERHHHHHRFRRGPVVVWHEHSSGDAFVAGMMGLALGAIIAGAAAAPEPVYDLPADYYPAPPAPLDGTLEPWTPAWYDWCARRFRSFDAKSGTYMGFDGKRHFCV